MHPSSVSLKRIHAPQIDVIVIIVVVVIHVFIIIVIYDGGGGGRCCPVPQRGKDEEEEESGEEEEGDGGSGVEELAILDAEVPDAAKDHGQQREHQAGQIQLLDQLVVVGHRASASHSFLGVVVVGAVVVVAAGGTAAAVGDEAVDDGVVGYVVVAEG